MTPARDGTLEHALGSALAVQPQKAQHCARGAVDYVELPAFTLKGYGHYHDEYVKQAGRWRIKSTRLTRLRCDVTPGPEAGGATQA